MAFPLASHATRENITFNKVGIASIPRCAALLATVKARSGFDERCIAFMITRLTGHFHYQEHPQPHDRHCENLLYINSVPYLMLATVLIGHAPRHFFLRQIL